MPISDAVRGCGVADAMIEAPGAIHIPFASVQDALKDIPKDRTLVFTGGHGKLSSQAAKLAEDQGYKTATFCPIQSWKDQGYTTEPGKKP